MSKSANRHAFVTTGVESYSKPSSDGMPDKATCLNVVLVEALEVSWKERIEGVDRLSTRISQYEALSQG